jgi:hypothetical protein
LNILQFFARGLARNPFEHPQDSDAALLNGRFEQPGGMKQAFSDLQLYL